MAAWLASCGDDPRTAESKLLFEEPLIGETYRQKLARADAVDTLRLGERDVVLTVGRVEGDEHYLLQDVKSVFVDETAHELYVVDRGRREVLVYSTDGTFLRSIGGRGQGPGEFEEPVDVFAVAADSIGVWDPALQRVTVFSRAGKVSRTVNLGQIGNQPIAVRLARDMGRMRFVKGRFVMDTRSNPLKVVDGAQTGALLSFDATFEGVDTLIRYRVPQIAAQSSENEGSQVAYYEAPPIFAPQPVWDARADGVIAFAPGGPYHVIQMSSTQPSQRLNLQLDAPAERVSRKDRTRRLEFEAAKPGSGIPAGFPIAVLERIAREKFSRFRPAITDVLWDGEARVWLRRFDTGAHPEGPASVWDVVDLMSQRLDRVLDFPSGFEPMAVTANNVYGIQIGGLGVARMVVLPHPLAPR